MSEHEENREFQKRVEAARRQTQAENASAQNREELLRRIKRPITEKDFPGEYGEYQRLKGLYKGKASVVGLLCLGIFLLLAAAGLGVLNMRYGAYLRAASFIPEGIGFIGMTLAYVGLFIFGAMNSSLSRFNPYIAAAIVVPLPFGVWYYTNKLPIVPALAPVAFVLAALVLIVLELKGIANARRLKEYNENVLHPLAEKVREELRQEYRSGFGEEPEE